MTISEILQQIADRHENNGIILVREGLFWRAYEHGALALCECVHPFKITARYYKCIDQWLCYVGFPDTSLQRWTEGRQLDKIDENMLCLQLTDAEQKHIADNFNEWKAQQIARVKAGTAAEKERQGGSGAAIGELIGKDKQVIMRLQAFPLERSSPLECMTFISELKSILQN